MTFVSYAQNFEDVMLWRALKDVSNGCYIDVGAAHPDIDSVTRAFYDRGWSGINIEPVPDSFKRLAASRLRDVNLCCAVGRSSGTATLQVVPGTGLSTLRDDVPQGLRSLGYAATPLEVPLDTLAAICRSHITGREAGGEIHFLKIDVEGAEDAVIEGADFVQFRPWIVLVEATVPGSPELAYGSWEPALLSAGYRYVYFDGLNRFYVAEERHAALAPLLAVPPNVFDDFIRVADTEWARRVADAEQRAREAAAEAAHRLQRLDEAAAAAEAGAVAHRRAVAQMQAAIAATERRRGEFEHERAMAERRHAVELHALHERLVSQMTALDRHAQAAAAETAALRRSASWRVTAPLRALLALARPPAPALPDAPAVAAMPAAPQEAPPWMPALPRHVRVVHQFHSGSAVGDAITNAMRLTRDLLRQHGYASEIFVEHLDAALGDDIRTLERLPRHAGYVLLLRHSMGYDAFDRILALPAPKVLIYHNITPPELLTHAPVLSRYAALGRKQLAALRPHVTAALADSEYTAVELQRLGFAAPGACTLLFDVAALRAKAAAPAPERSEAFTVLFVGRVASSKGQDDLIAAFAAFAAALAGPARLVIVGRHDGAGDGYFDGLMAAIGAAGLQEQVTLTGLVDEAALHGWYSAADLYVSLSRHEGFGVPLIEAFAYGVPVLARPCGAVPYILGGAAVLLEDPAPDAVAVQMLALAQDARRRAAQVERQAAVLDRFALERHVPVLLQALAAAGAPPPPDAGRRARLAANMRFTVTGHASGSYSLAAINRDLALALEAARPGSVRLRPVEGEATRLIGPLPACQRGGIEALAARAAPITGPELVISQHYPVHVPAERGDVCAALFFWEESVVPAATIAGLNGAFAGVFAASAFVAKALVDSGLSVPVRVVGHAPALGAFSRLAGRPGGERFGFLHVSSGFPRKGVDALLAAYAQAFTAADPVRLVIKVFPNPHNTVAAQLAALRAGTPNLAEITLVDADLDPAAVLDLFAAADAMVLPTRGEGFNLPAAEAMAAGLALIVTGYGGHMDFCTADNARLVDYRFAPSASHLATPHSVWAEPDIGDLAAALRQAVADRALPGGGPTALRVRRAARTAAAMTDAAALLQRVTTAGVALLCAPERVPPRIGWVSSWAVRCGIAEYSRHLAGAVAAAGGAAITVFCDHRVMDASRDGGVAVQPCWDLGQPAAVPQLALAIAGADPEVVLVQHQPALLDWPILADILALPAMLDRPVAVMLHNTRHLATIDQADRARVAGALGGVARVLVHTVADLNEMKALGLAANVTLLPHGAPGRAPVLPPRALGRGDAVVVGCYGFALPGKGLGALIEAMAILRQTWPAARLRLVTAEYGTAESAAELAAGREAADRLGVPAEWHTAFLPNEESLALLAGCDVVVLPYQRSLESSSAALRTALCAGPPVAVSDLALFDEADDAVFRLGGRDAAAIAAGLDRLLPDAAARQRIQAQASAWLATHAWDAVGGRLAGLLHGLAVNWRAPSAPDAGADFCGPGGVVRRP